jgi:hypothetical protein
MNVLIVILHILALLGLLDLIGAFILITVKWNQFKHFDFINAWGWIFRNKKQDEDDYHCGGDCGCSSCDCH